MNNRIKELARQAGITENNLSDGGMSLADLAKFAELIIREVKEVADYDTVRRIDDTFGIEE